jgi:hypothetical protein
LSHAPNGILDFVNINDDAQARADLHDVLARIPSDRSRVIECAPGWYALVAACDRELAGVASDYQILQVKEKYGELRYYVDLPPRPLTCCEQFRTRHPEPSPQSFASRQWQTLWAAHLQDSNHLDADARRLEERHRTLLAMEAVIDRYEAVSVRTCERCGCPGELMRSSDNWLKALCGTCASEDYTPLSTS